MSPPLVIVGAVDRRTIRIESADSLLVIKNGVVIDQMSPECMIATARAMIAQANLALETRPKIAEQIAFDSGLLLRGGIPLGLTNNPRILDMARTEAVSNRDLRRAMPGGVKSAEQFGTPSVSHVIKRSA